MRPAARESMALRAEGWDWTASPAGLEYGRQRHTNTRRQTTMDTDDKLRRIFGNLRGGRLEDVADKLIALFREPEWWEEEFEKQFVAHGSIEALQDAEKCDAVKAFIRTLLTRAQHEERQQFLRDIERIQETVFAVAASPEEIAGGNGTLCCCMTFDKSTGRHKPSQESMRRVSTQEKPLAPRAGARWPLAALRRARWAVPTRTCWGEGWTCAAGRGRVGLTASLRTRCP